MTLGCSQLTQHARNIPSAVCLAPPEDEQAMLETCREALTILNKLNKKYITLVSLYYYDARSTKLLLLRLNFRCRLTPVLPEFRARELR
jgi:hypothetical protein